MITPAGIQSKSASVCSTDNQRSLCEAENNRASAGAGSWRAITVAVTLEMRGKRFERVFLMAEPVKHIYDIAIVGGVLAGSALAKAMAEKHFRVIVLERETEFRDRVRGEQMACWSVAEARELNFQSGAM
jgi:NADPH-dependent 2,4-dienoyl-CoA reductase/sulfur reductase-like enzyme